MSTEPDFERPRPPAPESGLTVRNVCQAICLAGLMIAGFVSLSIGADSPYTLTTAAYMFAAVLALGWAAFLLRPEK